jgi:hypothetical protein
MCNGPSFQTHSIVTEKLAHLYTLQTTCSSNGQGTQWDALWCSCVDSLEKNRGRGVFHPHGWQGAALDLSSSWTCHRCHILHCYEKPSCVVSIQWHLEIFLHIQVPSKPLSCPQLTSSLVTEQFNKTSKHKTKARYPKQQPSTSWPTRLIVLRVYSPRSSQYKVL